MDLNLDRIRAACRQHRALVVGVIAVSLIIGIYIGFRLVGPALLG